MPLPLAANTTCDIYRTGNSPPAAPNVAAVAVHLKADWPAGQEHGDRAALSTAMAWTHLLLVEVSVDIRDGYTGATSITEQDSVYVPDKNGTRFKVTFIERVFRGQPQEHKRVYLDRQGVTWPSNEL